jgi:hypothetical protein
MTYAGKVNKLVLLRTYCCQEAKNPNIPPSTELLSFVRFHFLMATSMKITAFREATEIELHLITYSLTSHHHPSDPLVALNRAI